VVNVLPYETLVRMGVMQARIIRLVDQLRDLEEELDDMLVELTGVDDVEKISNLRDGFCHEFWNQFGRDVARAMHEVS
jgi:hypothetical protein